MFSAPAFARKAEPALVEPVALPVQTVPAARIAVILQRLFPRDRVTAESNANRLIVRASPGDVEAMRQIVTALDVKSPTRNRKLDCKSSTTDGVQEPPRVLAVWRKPALMRRFLTLAILVLLTGTPVAAAPAARPILITADAIPWSPRPGSEFALLEGSMSGSGPYAFRIKFLAHGESYPEYHSSVDHIVVLSGTFYLGFGKRFEKNHMRALRAGSFAAIPRMTAHFTMADRGTVIQVYGIGPRITTDMQGRPK